MKPSLLSLCPCSAMTMRRRLRLAIMRVVIRSVMLTAVGRGKMVATMMIKIMMETKVTTVTRMTRVVIV